MHERSGWTFRDSVSLVLRGSTRCEDAVPLMKGTGQDTGSCWFAGHGGDNQVQDIVRTRHRSGHTAGEAGSWQG